VVSVYDAHDPDDKVVLCTRRYIRILMSRFTKEDRFFDTEEPFRDEYTPEKILERDEEISEYEDALSPIIRGQPPKNVFLIGKAGVGKTVITDDIMQDLREEVHEDPELNVNIIKVQCRNLDSSYQVAVKALNEMNDIRGEEKVSTTGYPKQDIFDMLYDALDDLGGVVLFVFDEIDNIGDDDDILYEIPRARSHGNVTESHPAVIGISNDYRFRDRLSPEVKDTLCDEEIHFSPYDANELRSILRARAEKALNDGVYESSVIDLAAAKAAQDSGSARQSLRLLYKAGEIARDKDEDADLISEKHIRLAEESLQRKKIEEGIKNLTAQGHAVFFSIVRLSARSETPVRTKDVYEEYEKVTEYLDMNKLVQRRIYDHINELMRYGFIDSEMKYEGGDQGSYRRYSLSVSIDLARTALSEVSRFKELVERMTASNS
jgi:cell division control protein 6